MDCLAEEGKVSVVVQLPADGELLVRVPGNEPRCHAVIKVVAEPGASDPKVDVAGAPLVPDIQYYLIPGICFTVFAWSNAVVHIEGSASLVKNVVRSPSRSATRAVVEFHCQLHKSRIVAEQTASCGPVTLVCGMNSSEKISVARSLCSYAARAGWKPLLVDLDCGASQTIGIPGSIGAAVVEYPMSIDEVISLSQVCTTFFTGSLDPQHVNSSGELVISLAYSHFSDILLRVCRKRLSMHCGDVYASSGSVVIVPELRDNSGVNYVADIAHAFGAAHILCIGDDYLFHKLFVRLSGTSDRGIHVDRLSQSNQLGVPSLDLKLLPRIFNNYFHGSGAVVLQPSQWTKCYTMLTILHVMEVNGQVVLVDVERNALQGIIGCIGALFLSSKVTSALQSSPLAYARIQSIDATGVSFLTTTHFTFPSERLTVVVGSVRWITSTDL